MKLEDLPESMQRQVREKAGIAEPRKKDRTGSTVRIDGTCWTCGEHFTHVKRWEEHTAANDGHRRLELIAERPA